MPYDTHNRWVHGRSGRGLASLARPSMVTRGETRQTAGCSTLTLTSRFLFS